jgi:hypothetical protein
VPHVRPELWAEKNWILHHDNAPLHSALIGHEVFAKNDIPSRKCSEDKSDRGNGVIRKGPAALLPTVENSHGAV